MSVSLYQKATIFQNFTLHYLCFKNVNPNDFDELFDAVNDSLFEHKASVLSSVISGSKSAAKAYKNATKKVFDEVNWPVSWIGNSNESSYSGNFIAISGVNMKTFLSSGFISKIVDTPDARFVFLGEVLASSKNSKDQFMELKVHVDSALGMVGLTQENMLRSSYYADSLLDTKMVSGIDKGIINLNNPNLISSFFACSNQHKKPLMASFFACQVKNEKINIETLKISNGNKALLMSTNDSSRMLWIEKIGLPNTQSSPIDEQILKTLEFIEEFMIPSGFKWQQLFRGMAYFSDAIGVGIFKRICKEKQIPLGTILMIQPDFAEKNIQFEFEADFAIAYEG